MVSLRDVAIDMPAGPSEVEVLADETANPSFVAADLLSQAEHGADSQAILITTSPALQQAVKEEVERQLALLPRKEIAEKSLANSKLIVVRNMDEAIELTNSYAPEHLIIETADYMSVAERVVNAGSVFFGLSDSGKVQEIMLRALTIRCPPMAMPKLIAVSALTALYVKLLSRKLSRKGYALLALL